MKDLHIIPERRFLLGCLCGLGCDLSCTMLPSLTSLERYMTRLMADGTLPYVCTVTFGNTQVSDEVISEDDIPSIIWAKHGSYLS